MSLYGMFHPFTRALVDAPGMNYTNPMFNKTDVIIAGAGFAGAVLAERLAESGKKVLIVEKKQHIGGHCYDFKNDAGILIHKFGPHIFHTGDQKAWDYLSRFTDWYYYQHTVLGHIDGQKVPIPFNLNSLHSLFPASLANRIEEKLVKQYGFGSRVPILELRKSDDSELQNLADYIYRKIFLNYTLKQWGGLSPEDLDPSVSGRIPVVISRDNRYFHDQYQGIPSRGYTAIFEKMLDHPNISLLLNTDLGDVVTLKDGVIYTDSGVFKGSLVYTGMIDELFDFKFGELPYRSVRFEWQDHDREFYQENSLMNYPNNYDFTRITEYKYFQNTPTLPGKTTIGIEYPQDYIRDKNDPYYIIQGDDNGQRYEQYKALASSYNRLVTVGRLADYKYYNMDQIISRSLEVAEDILK